MDHIYEVRDTSNDEMYYPIAIFKTIDEFKVSMAKANNAGESYTEYGAGGGEHEEISVYRREFGFIEAVKVLEVKRETYYLEGSDDYKWRTIATEIKS